MANLGLLICLGFGFFFPEEDYNPALKNNKKNLLAKEADIADGMWRFFNFFPVLMNLLMLLLFCMFIKGESIMFAI